MVPMCLRGEVSVNNVSPVAVCPDVTFVVGLSGGKNQSYVYPTGQVKLQRGEATTESPQPPAPGAVPVALPGDMPGAEHSDDTVKERSRSITDQLSNVSLQTFFFFFFFFSLPLACLILGLFIHSLFYLN